MDWLLVLALLWLICMAAMVPMMWGRGGRMMGFYMPGRTADGWAPESARQVLDRRYASGEIDEETYKLMRAGLESPAAPH